MTTRILIADDHLVVREGLRAMLARIPEAEVVGEADNGQSAYELALNLSPDLVILDLSMPVLDGLESTRKILAERPKTRILGLSMHTEMAFVKGFLEAGAHGYLLKSGIAEELSLAILQVLRGDTYISSRLYEPLTAAPPARPVESSLAALSPRELQVLRFLAEGRRTKEIASELNISPRTVEVYRAQISKKLGLDSIVDLVKIAIREGLVRLDS